jgi:hypothetical protein
MQMKRQLTPSMHQSLPPLLFPEYRRMFWSDCCCAGPCAGRQAAGRSARNIEDAQLKDVSTENRFDAAYKAIMQLSMVALRANGSHADQQARTSPDGYPDIASKHRSAAGQGHRARCVAQAA